MPKKIDREEDETPKSGYRLRSRRKKKKSLEAKCAEDSDSDSSSDYDPDKDDGEVDEKMDAREFQRFVQKIFPSKSGKERLRQLEKIDKLLEKKDRNKKKSRKNKSKNKSGTNYKIDTNDFHQEDEVEFDCEYCEDEGCENCEELVVDDDFPDEEEIDDNMLDMLGGNTKFNIIFTVGRPNPRGQLYDSAYDDEEDVEDCISEDEYTEEEEEDGACNTCSGKIEYKKDKKYEDCTEEEWREIAYQQEQQMRENGTYYSTKYNKDDKILLKLKGWDEFKKGIVTKVHRNKQRRLVKYNIKLDKKYKGKKIYEKVSSRKMKSFTKSNKENADILGDLKTIIESNKNGGNDAMLKKLGELTKAQEKRDAAKKKKKEAKEKEKNFSTLKKLMRERNVMNDFKFFKGMELHAQNQIIRKLKEINEFSKIEKPYKLTLIEADIPVEFKANALKKINTLQYMDPGSGEYYKIKQWVDTFMRIPFGKHNTLPITMGDGVEKCQEFMEKAKQVLDDAVYGLNDAKMQVLQMVGQWISNPDSLGTAIAVKGPPGTGKTTLIKDGVSKILGRPFHFCALGGATDSSFLEGHSYTYEGSVWGKIVDILLNCKCMNPVIYFDELDKISDTPKGEEIVGILTHLTDTTQNDKFHDKYFSNIDFNLSKAMFIFSYNDESKVNPILKDRMYRIKTDGYKNEDKCIIAHNYLIPKIEKNVNFKKGQVIIPDETLLYIAGNLTDNEKGVRNLKRCLEIIYTKLNLYRLMKAGSSLFNKEETIKVTFPFTVSKEIVEKLVKKTNESAAPFGMYL